MVQVLEYLDGASISLRFLSLLHIVYNDLAGKINFESLSICNSSLQMREDTDQENSKYKHFSRIETEYY